MKYTIPKTILSVSAILLCLSVGTLMADDRYPIQSGQWCCPEPITVQQEVCCPAPITEVCCPAPITEVCCPEPVTVSEEACPPEVPAPTLKPEPIIPLVVIEPPVEPTPEPEPIVVVTEEVVSIPEAPVVEQAEPEPEKPLPATASNWMSHLLAGLSLIGAGLGLRKIWAA